MSTVPGLAGRVAPHLRRVLIVVMIIAAAIALGKGLISFETTRLFYVTTGHAALFTTIVVTQLALFAAFGLLTVLVVGGSLWWFFRHRPAWHPDYHTQLYRWQFMRLERPLRVPLTVLVVGLLAYRAGAAAAGQWQTALAWAYARPWGVVDSHFHRDAAFFVATVPFATLVVAAVSTAFTTAIAAVLVVAFPYGALLPGKGRPRVASSLHRQLSVLLAGVAATFAVATWWSRYAAMVTSGGPVTGASYTDLAARIPGRAVIAVAALALAAVLVVNAVRPMWRTLAIAGLGFALVVGICGTAWPVVVQRFREAPSESSIDLPEIVANQRATLHAFGLDGDVVRTVPYGTRTLRGTALTSQAARNAQVRVLDPNVMSPTFNVKQQLESYYGFRSTLDIGRYPIDGRQRDLALSVRTVNASNLPRSSWDNTHLVYTHGYGVVAALTDQLDERTGEPIFVNGGLPARNAVPVTVPQVYYGPGLPSYSIVDGPGTATHPREFDHPGDTAGAGEARTTYAGTGGIGIGSVLRRALFAAKYGSANILFSSEVGSGSRLIGTRDPRARVARLAPWLTLDGSEYPVISHGRIYWIVDAYTSSSSYPEGQQVNLFNATNSPLGANGSTTQQPSTNVNYLRNSVKAVVDAYNGTVTLYEWNQQDAGSQQAQPDPLLQLWERAFPGLVHPQSEMPPDLVAHLRYPQDLFGVQRTILARYHVSDPSAFYAGSGFWQVPNDPTLAASQAINTGGSTGGMNLPLASVYQTMSVDGFGKPTYTLSSPMVTLNQRSLAAFITVDSTPGPDYGHFTVLEPPAGASVPSPAQIQNDVESSTRISEALTLQRGGNSTVILGNLLCIPLGGRMLYVEPVYTRAAGGGSFPVLRHVIAAYGDSAPSFEATLPAALSKALGSGGRG